MNTETKVLTDEQLIQILKFGDSSITMGRAIEQAVLNSPDVVAMRKDLEEYVGIANELATENEALRKDAERYRWVKANLQANYDLPGIYYLPDETYMWDATVDAAMKDQA